MLRKLREIQLTLKSISICTGARWWRRGLGPDNGSKGALLFHCRDDIGRWEWENAVCTATVWREGDRRGCHGRAWRHYCNKAKIIRTQIEVFTANTEKESDRALPLKIYIYIKIYIKKMKCLGLATLWITGKLFCVGLLLQIAQSNFLFFSFFFFLYLRLYYGTNRSIYYIHFYVQPPESPLLLSSSSR